MSHVFNTCHWSPWSRLEGSTADTSDARGNSRNTVSLLLAIWDLMFIQFTSSPKVFGGISYATRFYLIAYPSLKYKYQRPESTWTTALFCTVPLAFNWERFQVVHIWQTTYFYDFNLAYQYDVATASKLPPWAWCQKKLDTVRLWFNASVI